MGTYYEQRAENLLSVIKDIPNYEGYQVLYSPNSIKQFPYVYVITPRNNVLCLSCAEFFGFNATLEYKPVYDKNIGRGCRCNDEPVFDFSLENLVKLENAGLSFANRLGATKYTGLSEWLKDVYKPEELVDLKANEPFVKEEDYER